MSFLTLEDVNTALYSNQGFYWHCLDLTILNQTSEEFTDIKVDFCKVSRLDGQYAITIDNPYWAKGYCLYVNGSLVSAEGTSWYNNQLWIINHAFSVGDEIKMFLYMGIEKYSTPKRHCVSPEQGVVSLDLKHINRSSLQVPVVTPNGEAYPRAGDVFNPHKGVNEVIITGNNVGFIFIDFLKTDFKFNCNQELVNGKINKVQLGTDTDYLPDGDLIGEYTPSIRVLYNDKTLPVTYDNTLNDYTFDLDLTEETTEHKIHLKVLIDSNEVLNSTSTDVTLQSSFETINTLQKLEHLFSVGGVGRLGSDLTITDDLTVNNDVYLIGNEHTLNMQSHKIIIPTDKIFKAEQTTFTNGENTIQQNEASKVELINCTFTDCTGLGSVIDCQIDVTSLDNPTDFTTTLNKCTLNNNDMCILHGGELTITDCTINGKISDDKYPYFLYQTDGEAHITGTVFNLTHNTPITADIGYNSCIFTVGEQATINYGDHTEYSQNNVTGFLENSRNISIINVTYYYPPIEDYVTLQSTKGYCHSVSSVDFVFKTHVQLTRSE